MFRAPKTANRRSLQAEFALFVFLPVRSDHCLVAGEPLPKALPKRSHGANRPGEVSGTDFGAALRAAPALKVERSIFVLRLVLAVFLSPLKSECTHSQF